MNNFFLTLSALLLLMTAPARAEVVDPHSNDQWKTLNVTIKQLDERTLPDQYEDQSYIEIHFASQVVKMRPKDISVGNDFTHSFTVPARTDDEYSIVYMSPDFGYIEMKRGNAKSGTTSVEAHLKRIDINHMVITRQDGTTYTSAAGTVYVKPMCYSYASQDWRQCIKAGGNWSVAQRNSGTGVDVPVGYQYQVEAYAKSEDGPDSYRSNLLDFTKL
jgi:hypothetical protein